jgi:hypothetical protein
MSGGVAPPQVSLVRYGKEQQEYAYSKQQQRQREVPSAKTCVFTGRAWYGIGHQQAIRSIHMLQFLDFVESNRTLRLNRFAGALASGKAKLSMDTVIKNLARSGANRKG